MENGEWQKCFFLCLLRLTWKKYGINKNVDVVTGSLLRNCICAATVCLPKNNRFYVVINDYTAPYPAEAVAGMPAIGC